MDAHPSHVRAGIPRPAVSTRYGARSLPPFFPKARFWGGGGEMRCCASLQPRSPWQAPCPALAGCSKLSQLFFCLTSFICGTPVALFPFSPAADGHPPSAAISSPRAIRPSRSIPLLLHPPQPILSLPRGFTHHHHFSCGGGKWHVGSEEKPVSQNLGMSCYHFSRT